MLYSSLKPGVANFYPDQGFMGIFRGPLIYRISIGPPNKLPNIGGKNWSPNSSPQGVITREIDEATPKCYPFLRYPGYPITHLSP